MKAEIVSIGNELLIGDTVNTNASWIGQLLTEEGLDVTAVHTIGDDLEVVKETIRRSMERSDLVISTGGLGPTHDDVTKKALQELFDAEMVVDESVLNFVKKMFEKRNIPFTKSNYHQAEVLNNAEVLFNTQGTAPGLWFEELNSSLAVLPGVPFEMKHLMREKVLPKFREKLQNQEYRRSRYLVTAGIGESTLSDSIIGDLAPFLQNGTTVAYLPSPYGVRIRITSAGRSVEEIEQKISPVADHIYEKAGSLLIGEGKELSLSEALGKELRKKEMTIATAESCTGGLLSSTLTDVPGSSDYTMGGIIAYSNNIKEQELNISASTLEKHGAVSKPVALQMARNVAEKFGTDIGVSATGIAGPGGGTEDKPVGTVWIGFWSEEKHFALKTIFTKDRLQNKERTVAVAMETVRRVLLDMETMPYGLEPEWA
ncbi:competence/damage-inducible protein A [Aliifodinibius sp. S!AR15-10]|uniref:competence/damage-inducible protein A n=1 Tax=Aliifodinibius sp. S!AR15-10 TaxID=2950437 RepID=UPI00286466F2|nr:competence/damage-inducible protein A [Aliifodinibius sp. S!AR15-10]MDR8390291.1 competence/damage-inducible protein A [Aliifodinibius sp. S!AR15-10]